MLTLLGRLSEMFQPSLHHLLELIRPNPRFKKLASKAARFLVRFHRPRDDALPPLIKAEAYDEILDFVVAPWTIPTEEELSAWEIWFTTPLKNHTPLYKKPRIENPLRHGYIAPPLVVPYSAAAAAIHFMQSLTHCKRVQLRILTIDETQHSQCFPHSHARGFVRLKEWEQMVTNSAWRANHFHGYRDLRDDDSMLPPRHAISPKPKFQFSATAATIRFLSNASPSMRLSIRKITIREIHHSEVFPYCHARGLIPFCQENPKLRIVSRIHSLLWQLPHALDGKALHNLHTTWRRFWGDDEYGLYYRFHFAKLDWEWGMKLPSITMLHAIRPWIEETMALPSLGMPSESFTLHLDGSSTNAFFARYKLREAALVAGNCVRYMKTGPCDALSCMLTQYVRTWEYGFRCHFLSN